MRKKLPRELVNKIIERRSKGNSIPEISQALSIPKTTVYRYAKDVKVIAKYLKVLRGRKTGGSRNRMIRLQEEALRKGVEIVQELSKKEKLLFLCAIYWAEGNKKELILTNTDPEIIRMFTNGLRELFGVSDDRIKVSIRIYSDLNQNDCLNFWSAVTKIPKEKFYKTYVLEGKKVGKLKYGMCRVRISKGSSLLKQIQGINLAFVHALAKIDKIPN